MTYAIGNSHARAHERAYEAQQQAADDQERYEAWIDDQADNVLRAPFVYMSIIEEAEASMVGSQYLDAMRLAFLSDAAGFTHIAKSYKATALAPLEREIKDILRIKTPKSQWRKQQELCHEY